MGFSTMKKIHICGVLFLVIVLELCPSFIVMAASDHPDFSRAILLRVDQSGNGDFRKIQDAIDAVPSNNRELYFIWIKAGVYREKVVVPADKPYITISGTKASNTIITWGDGGRDIFQTATFSVLANDFVARFITIQNTFGPTRQAVALLVSGDRAAFYGCRFLSFQDTLLDDKGRHYFSNCYIEGGTDFICGNAASLYEKCRLHSLSEVGGAITAHQRSSAAQNTGYTFLGCRITGVGTTVLGRPWGAYSRVVFAMTSMSKAVLPHGWDNWGDASKERTSFYGEYKSYGPGAATSGRVKWSHILSASEAAPFLSKNMIGGRGWLRPAPSHFKRRSGVISRTAEGNE